MKTKKEFFAKDRYFLIKKIKTSWIYDAFTNNVYSFPTELVNVLEKKSKDDVVVDIKQKLNQLEDIIPEKKNEKTLNVIINLSNRCNLNCSYCYRRKNDNKEVNIEKIDNAITLIMNNYYKDYKNYNFTFSMTSESSIELEKLKGIAILFDKYENWLFKKDDFITDNFHKIYKELFQLFKNTNFEWPVYSPENTVFVLNKLLNRKDLLYVFQINKNKLPDYIKKEIDNISDLDYWKLHRVNRWLIEFYFSGYFKSANVKYCSFNFFTNGTNANKDYIKFFKNLGKDTIMISIDGNKRVHDRNRFFYNKKGSYNTIKNNIKIFHDNGLKLKASATLTRNYPYPHKIIKQIKKLGFIGCEVCVVREGTNCSFEIRDLSRLFKSYKKIYKKLYSTLIKRKYEYIKFIRADACITPLLTIINGTKILTRCGLENQIVIDTNGDIYDCLYFCSKKVGKIGNITLDFQKNQDKYKELQVTNRRKCMDCWARYLCGGTCFYNSFITTGNLLEPSKIECMIKEFYTKECIKLLIKLKRKKFDIRNIISI